MRKSLLLPLAPASCLVAVEFAAPSLSGCDGVVLDGGCGGMGKSK